MTKAELKAKLVRKASRAIVGGFRPPTDPFASWFGSVRVALPDETWPEYNGKLMMPLCQVNLSELPYHPDNLADIAFLTVFIQQEDVPSLHAAHGDGWILRAYPSLNELTPIVEPKKRGDIKPFPIHWELITEDYPTWDSLPDGLAAKLPPELDDNYYDHFLTQPGTKIGGWPNTIQSEINWAPFNRHPANPEFVFQIASEYKANYAWGDDGVGYFGRGTGDARNQWTMDWQCY